MHTKEVSKNCFLEGQGAQMGQKWTFLTQKRIFLPFLGVFWYKTINLLIWPHLATGYLLTIQYLYIDI